MNTDQICPRGYSADTLSAYRDNVLPTEVAAAVRAHTPECPSCQTTLAHFAMVARTLRLQRDVDPGQRVWSGVRLGMTQRRPPMSTTARRILSGISAALAVLVIVVLFAQLLHSKFGSSTVTTTATSTQTGKGTPLPTSTFPATPGVSNFVTAAQAWGPNAGSTFSTALDAQHIFVADRVAADGTAIYGNDILVANNQPKGESGATGALTIATKQFTPFAGLSPVSTMGSPFCCYTAGHYVLALDNSQPGATCGPCHSRLWAKDLQTGQVRKLVDGGIEQPVFDDHNVVIYDNVLTSNDQGIMSVDIATGAITTLAHMPGSFTNSIGLQALAWPLLVYSTTPQSTSSTTTEHVHNVVTGADITLTGLTGAQNAHQATLFGDTLFYTSQNGNTITVYQLDHPMAAGAQPQTLGTYPAGLGDLTAANARLLIFNGLDTFAWDRVQQRFVALSALTNDSNGTHHIGASLTGDWLMVTEQTGYVSPQTVTLFNSANLPNQG